jgi:hypothetical protein
MVFHALGIRFGSLRGHAHRDQQVNDKTMPRTYPIRQPTARVGQE